MPEWMNIDEMAPEQPEKRLHMERYEYAASVLKGKRVLDAACGMGYGTYILAAAGCMAVGIDIDPAAIELARMKYPACDFRTEDLAGVSIAEYDALVSFETLEHLAAPSDLIRRLPDNITDIVASAPIRPTVGWNPWHKSDFTHGSLCAMFEDAGFRIVHVIGQEWVDGKGDLYMIIHSRRGNWTL